MTLTLLAAWLLPVSQVRAQTLPQGWKETRQNNVRVFFPGDLKQGESAFILIFPPNPLGDLSPKAWLEKRVARINAGKPAQMKETREAGDFLLTGGTVNGKPTLYILRPKAGQATLFIYSANTQELLDRYTSIVTGVVRDVSTTPDAARTSKDPVPNATPQATPRPRVLALPRATSGSLPVAPLGGARIFIKYGLSFDTYARGTFDHLILFPDGTAFDDIPGDPMPRFDAATLRRMLEPRYVGRWKQTGNTLTLTFPKNSRTLLKHPQGWWDDKPPVKTNTSYDIYYPVLIATPKRVLGAWESQSLTTTGMIGGDVPVVSSGSSSDLQFRADGTFSNARKNFAGAIGNGTGIYRDRDQSAAGRWRLDGPLLTMEKNGERSVKVAFILPNWSKANSDLMIDGDWWERPKKKN
ncbi:MAG: hypothetical protein H8F28_11875 [Fibrella sp.]|nr:hypothetical protein [Armatimonadota bacterium]